IWATWRVGRMVRTVIFAGLVVASIYVLSVGPAVWLQSRGYIGDGALQIYQPVVVVSNSWQPLDRALYCYVTLFAPPVPPPPPVSTMPLPRPVASPGAVAPMPMPKGLRPAGGAP